MTPALLTAIVLVTYVAGLVSGLVWARAVERLADVLHAWRLLRQRPPEPRPIVIATTILKTMERDTP